MDEVFHVRQRVEPAKALLKAARLLSEACFPGQPFGSRADDLILHAAIFVGQADGRPMNASKFAEYAGVPRPTVIRKVAALVKQGIVMKAGDGFALVPAAVNSAAAVEAAAAASQVLSRIALPSRGAANK